MANQIGVTMLQTTTLPNYYFLILSASDSALNFSNVITEDNTTP